MIAESEMLLPVLRLFPKNQYRRYTEVPLGRKKIDLVCVARENVDLQICVELKVQAWKRALWQAAVNFQLGNHSYIALWHEFVHRVEAKIDLLEHYGVGLIAVEHDAATILHESRDHVFRIARQSKQDWFRMLASEV